jgi:hypothetical protein
MLFGQPEVQRAPSLDLHENQELALGGDEINFAEAPESEVLRHDPIPLALEIGSRERLSVRSATASGCSGGFRHCA